MVFCRIMLNFLLVKNFPFLGISRIVRSAVRMGLYTCTTLLYDPATVSF